MTAQKEWITRRRRRRRGTQVEADKGDWQTKHVPKAAHARTQRPENNRHDVKRSTYRRHFVDWPPKTTLTSTAKTIEWQTKPKARTTAGNGTKTFNPQTWIYEDKHTSITTSVIQQAQFTTHKLENLCSKIALKPIIYFWYKQNEHVLQVVVNYAHLCFLILTERTNVSTHKQIMKQTTQQDKSEKVETIPC